jgi:hypothetical protein
MSVPSPFLVGPTIPWGGDATPPQSRISVTPDRRPDHWWGGVPTNGGWHLGRSPPDPLIIEINESGHLGYSLSERFAGLRLPHPAVLRCIHCPMHNDFSMTPRNGHIMRRTRQMRHRRSFRDGTSTEPPRHCPSMAFVVLAGGGVFAIQAYAGRAGDKAARQATQWRSGMDRRTGAIGITPGRRGPLGSLAPRRRPSTARPSPRRLPSASSSTSRPVCPHPRGGDCALPRYPTPGCTGVPAGCSQR